MWYYIMPKHKSKQVDPMEELINELNNATDEVRDAARAHINEPPAEVVGDDINSKRQEQTQSSEDGEISKSIKYLRKELE